VAWRGLVRAFRHWQTRRNSLTTEFFCFFAISLSGIPSSGNVLVANGGPDAGEWKIPAPKFAKNEKLKTNT